MRILGIDPGLRVTGFGLIDTRGDAMRYVTSGVIRSGEVTIYGQIRFRRKPSWVFWLMVCQYLIGSQVTNT